MRLTCHEMSWKQISLHDISVGLRLCGGWVPVVCPRTPSHPTTPGTPRQLLGRAATGHRCRHNVHQVRAGDPGGLAGRHLCEQRPGGGTAWGLQQHCGHPAMSGPAGHRGHGRFHHVDTLYLPVPVGELQHIQATTKWPPFAGDIFLTDNVWFFKWNFTEICHCGSHWWYVCIGLGHGLVPSGTKPLTYDV